MSQIQIVQPFDSAWAGMVRILFQPFSWRKWFGLGFCAFLADLVSGGSSANLPSEAGSGSETSAPFWTDPLVLTIIIAVILIIVGLLIVFTWLSCRGKFMFLDGVVHDRGLIAHPWKEFRNEARSLFHFTLLYAICVVSGMAVLGFSAWAVFDRIGPAYDIRVAEHLLLTIAFAIVVILFVLTIWLVSYSVRDFIVPAMYLRRSLFMQEARRFVDLLTGYPVEFIYYTMFRTAIAVICTVVMIIGICATCCIAAIPYISSVFFLPILVLIRLYPLHFLAQFGPGWNALAAEDSLPAPASEPETPPVPPV